MNIKINRYDWIDVTKGIAILMVMWGHVQNPSPLTTWINSFHVPSFLVTTGFLLGYKNKIDSYNFVDFKNHTLRKNIIPYICFSVVAIIVKLVYNFAYLRISPQKDLVIYIYKTITGYGISALWFIPSFLLAQYIFLQTVHHKSKIKNTILIISGIIIPILISWILSWLNSNISSYIYELIYYPIASFFRGYACTIFIFSGYGIYKLYSYISQKRVYKYLFLISGIICFLLNILLSKFRVGVNFSAFYLGRNALLLYVCGILGSIGLMTIVFLITTYTKKFKILAWLGKNSLILMGTHMSLLLTDISLYLVNIIWEKPANIGLSYYFYGVVCVIIMIIFEIPIINMINNKLPFIIGKNLSIKTNKSN